MEGGLISERVYNRNKTKSLKQDVTENSSTTFGIYEFSKIN